MRLMLHNFRKDARRLWPVVLLACAVLAMLARIDRWRADRLAGPTESWLTILLTMAWACLAALVVLEEPLTGDRNFWTTRPHRWPALLGAKVLFVVLAIHLPSCIASAYVLASRGFSPAVYLSVLIEQQLLLFGVVTLPAMALASLVRSFTHAVIAMFVVGAVMLIFNGGFQSFPDFARLHTAMRDAVARILIAVPAAAVIWLQYARRRLLPARAIAVTAALAVASLSTWFPARADYPKTPAAPRILVRPAALTPEIIQRVGGDQPAVLIPISIASVRIPGFFHVQNPDIEIDAPGEATLHSITPSVERSGQKIEITSMFLFESQEVWLMLRFSRFGWSRVKDARVTIRGAAAFDFYRPGRTTILGTNASADVPDLGRCSSTLREDSVYDNGGLKLLCESPADLRAANVVLRHEFSGRQWKFGLNSLFPFMAGPHESWLSPLHRAQSFFSVTSAISSDSRSEWRVPAAIIPWSHFEITPEIPTGAALATFTFKDVALADYDIRR